MQQFWLAVGFGLVSASTLAIASVGLTLQFGITNYINFAYGDYMALGAFFTLIFNNEFLHQNIWLSLVLGSVGMGVVAVLVNMSILGPYARRAEKPVYVLIVTFGLSLIILNVISAFWGTDVRFYNIGIEHVRHVGPFLWTNTQMYLMGLAVVLMLLVHVMLKTTRLGKSMRAMSDNVTLAITSGIDTKRITTITWFMSGTLAGLAGTVLAINEGNLTPASGELYLFVLFACVITGGVGSVYGAMLGAVIIGLATEVSPLWINAGYKNDVAFVILIAALLFRPNGLIGRTGKV